MFGETNEYKVFLEDTDSGTIRYVNVMAGNTPEAIAKALEYYTFKNIAIRCERYYVRGRLTVL